MVFVIMFNKNKLLDNPGINQFIQSHTLRKRMEAYQQIPPWEMDNLWRLVARHGNLEHLEYIYQKKLANTTLYESMINFWYGSDVNGWEYIVKDVIAAEDIDKLRFIISKEAFKAIDVNGGFFDDVLDYFQGKNLSFIKAWMTVESKEAKDALHQIFLVLIQNAPNTELLSATVYSNYGYFISPERFNDYVNRTIDQGLIEPFKKLYEYIPIDCNAIEKRNNNELFKNILKHSNCPNFCKNALEHMTTHTSIQRNGKIHPILREYNRPELSKNHDAFKLFIAQFERELSSMNIITDEMKLELYKKRIFSVLDEKDQASAFVHFIKHESEEGLKTFLSEDNNLDFYYKCLEEIEFRKALKNQLDDLKLQSLDLPYDECIEHLNPFKQNAYYLRKSQEILKYIDVHSEIKRLGDDWSKNESAFMKQMSTKKSQDIPLTLEEQKKFVRLRELKAKPYLKYVEKGVTFSLAMGLSSSKKLNASKQMVIDTLNFCLKKQKSPNPLGIFGVKEYCPRFTHTAFVQKLISCGPICELLPLSFAKDRNQLLETLYNSPGLQYCLSALLDIPSFYGKGMTLDFYVNLSPDILDEEEAKKIRGFEGAMLGLTPDQEKILQRLQRHYKLPVSFDPVQKRQELKEIFVKRYQSKPLVVRGREMPLDYAPRLYLSQAEKEACYKDPLHSVIRYLSVPNTWLFPDLLHPEIPELATVDVKNKCAILVEDHIRLLWLFWLAARDTSEEMRPMEVIREGERMVPVTVEQRIQAYIEGIACAARTHNRDKTERQLGRGNSNKLVDDMDFDKPTCPHGAKQQIFLSLMDHPLRTINIIGPQVMIEDLRRNRMLRHIKAQIRIDNYQDFFKMLENPTLENQNALKNFNLPHREIVAFKAKIGEVFRNGLPWIYGKLIDHFCEKNQNCHALTCLDELNELADNPEKLINHLVYQILDEHLRREWKDLLEDKSFGVEYLKPLDNMLFAEELESFVSTIKPRSNYEGKFKEKFPQHKFSELFFIALDKYLHQNSVYLDVQDLLEQNLLGYTPYNQQEFLAQEKPITLRILADKLASFIEKQVGKADEMVLENIAELIGHIEDKLQAFAPTPKSRCRY